MAEEDRSAKIGRDAESSAIITGDRNTATITITNYYYSENTTVVPVDSTDAVDEKLPCPYRSLFHFGPDDAEYFFGREVFVEELFAATQTRNFIPLLGASGSGKSSVVLAGLVPKLQQEGHWLFTHFRPGSEPFHALAEALVPLYEPDKNATEQMAQARELAKFFVNGSVPLQDVLSKIKRNYPNHRVLLIADQFEELYTLCADQKTRHSFLDILLASFPVYPSQSQISRVLVATMRADFLGNALSYPQFGEVLRNADVKIRSMNREELSQVIVKPAEKLRVTFQDGLVKRILDDVEDQPGNLPLLEFALTELWNKRAGKQLTHQIYEEIGQVEGALARHADEKYRNLTDEEKEKVRRIFIQLVRPGEGVEDTRRIAMKAELGEQSWSLVKQLADARLVVTSRNATSQETVEVVHEALIRNWGELREWMNRDRVFRAWQERLRASKGQWEATNRDSDCLLRGATLAQAEEKLKERPEDLIDEKEFIQASIELRDKLRNRWWWIIGSVSLAISAAAVIAFIQWINAQKQLVSTIGALTNSSQELFDSNKEFDALLASLNAAKQFKMAAFGVDPNMRTQIEDALRNAVFWVKEYNRLEGHLAEVNSVSFSPNGQVLATGSKDDIIKLWDVATGKEIKTLNGNSVSFSPDGRVLATSSKDGIKLWDVATGNAIKTLDGHRAGVNSVGFSSNGLLASVNADGTITLWDIATNQEIKTLTGHNSQIIHFSPNGRVLASQNADLTITLWDVTNGTEIRTRPQNYGFIDSIRFSPNGQLLAIGGENTLVLWNIASGHEDVLSGHTNRLASISFSPNGKILASASWDHTIKLWDVATREEIKTFTGHKSGVNSISFSPDGKLLASASSDRTIKLWNIVAHNEIVPLKIIPSSSLGYGISFSPDGKLLASTVHAVYVNQPNTIKLWDVATHKEIATLRGHEHWILSVSFSPNGKLLASAAWDGTIRLWDVRACIQATICEASKTLKSRSSLYLLSVSFSPDGRLLASGDWDLDHPQNNSIQLWDVATVLTNREPIKVLQGHTNGVNSISFSPDGKRLASASKDQTIKLWDVTPGQEPRLIQTLKGHTDEVTRLSFSPDGKRLASASRDQTIKLWDVATRKEIKTLTGHIAPVSDVSFSPNGQWLVSASEDKTIKLWDVATRKEIATFKGHKDWDAVSKISLSYDGQLLASESTKELILWKVKALSNFTLEELMEKGCDHVRDYLQNNPNVSQSDRAICNGISTQK